MINLSTTFHANTSITFQTILPTNKQTHRQTEGLGRNHNPRPSPLVEVKTLFSSFSLLVCCIGEYDTNCSCRNLWNSPCDRRSSLAPVVAAIQNLHWFGFAIAWAASHSKKRHRKPSDRLRNSLMLRIRFDSFDIKSPVGGGNANYSSASFSFHPIMIYHSQDLV